MRSTLVLSKYYSIFTLYLPYLKYLKMLLQSHHKIIIILLFVLLCGSLEPLNFCQVMDRLPCLTNHPEPPKCTPHHSQLHGNTATLCWSSDRLSTINCISIYWCQFQCYLLHHTKVQNLSPQFFFFLHLLCVWWVPELNNSSQTETAFILMFIQFTL